MKKNYLFVLILWNIISFAQTYDYTIYNTSNSGIGSNYIGDIKTDNNGLLWISSYSGVSTFDGSTWTSYNTTNSDIASNAIIETEIDNLGRKWMASQNNGIILLDGTTWTNYTSTNSGLPSNDIFNIEIDSSNNLWITSDSGLTKFNGITWTTYNSLTNINSIEIDEIDGIWVTNNGIMYKFNGNDYNFIYQGTNKILKISEDKIYVAGFDSLFTFTIAGDFLTSYYQSTSCLAGYQLNALDINNNKVWIAFNGDGLQNFSDCVTYTNNNSGLPDNYFNTIKAENSGTIWAGTLQLGLVKMSPNNPTCNPPSQFWADSITTTTATLNWISANPTPDAYLYLYNTEPVIGGIDGNTTSTSANINNLSPNTDYHWWVASVCGNDQTQWLYCGSFTTLQAINSSCWQNISAGEYHSLAIKNDGTLWAWGRNVLYQLGDGTDVTKNIPTQIGTANNWVKVHAGYSSSYGIKADGTLWSWGSNGYGKLGTGNGNYVIDTPTQVGTDTNWLDVSDGWNHTIALKTDGTLWGWGNNEYGQLGDNTTVNKPIPTQISVATNWQTIATGINHSLAIKTDGTLWFWGSRFNLYGTSSQNNIPTQIGTDSNWLKLAGGQHHCAVIKTDGTLWTWGENSSGQLGDGTTTYRITPIQVGTATDWLDVSAGVRYTIATKNNLSIWSWGYNYSGQLGLGTSGNTSDVYIPTQVGSSLDSNKISAGGYHVLVINSDGFIRGTGSNVVGQIGDETFIQRNTFTYISCYPSTLSNEYFVINELKLYPNPVNDILNLSFDKEISAVSIYNLFGQEIITKHVNNKETSIDVAGLHTGTYLVKVISINEIKTMKIVKK
ncbi:conserved hypothetical protein [Flavobacterium sp. 9AF]|uniref:RCC1 domain-containing protein n=1 Tax=Flavobacterium sp. 9AF TaxID=2653142 RepID=UPI0012F14F1F|nr:T9SS type A sorting domain-containing protein [Flavobacterium sp. 9AF]VXB27790.1 conserved hypothetical protein [Flavobacterium sp. 9AF]